MRKLLKIFWFFTKLGIFFFILGIATLFVTYKIMEKDLPSVESIREYKLQVPLKILSKDGKLIAVFGSKRRSPIAIDKIPKHLINAYIAGEDANFYDHYGIDPKGIFRAVWEVVTTGEKKSGGSTITMQLTRNVFLSLEQTYTRKLKEIFLAIKLEQTISKDEILELYLNKNFLGHRSYGIVAAADTYYGKTLDELTLAECAMLAAPPKAPSRINPVTSPERALLRRNYILRRMLELNYITQTEHDQAVAEPDNARIHEPAIELNAPWIAEMVRAEMLDKYGDSAYSDGFVVTTTVDSKLQQAAEIAVQNGLQSYDKRHGFRGPLKHFDILEEANNDMEVHQVDNVISQEKLQQAIEYIEKLPDAAGLQASIITFVEEQSAIVRLVDGQDAVISFETSNWAAPYIDNERVGNRPKTMHDIVKIGDVIMVKRDNLGQFVLTQIPRVQGALISLNPDNGAVNSLIGGFAYNLSKFNRVTQAKRQPGSGFKPILYSGAIEAGLTASTLINDAPIVFDDSKLEKAWRPQNYSEKFFGPTRLREGIVHSRNLVSIRVLDRIGINTGRNHMLKFGFEPEAIPRDLSISLGSPNIPPIDMARAFSVFANGGYLIDPYLIETISNQEGEVLYQHEKVVLCDDCEGKLKQQQIAETIAENTDNIVIQSESQTTQSGSESEEDILEEHIIYPPRVISAANQFIIESFMKDVINRGTGAKAKALGRNDLAGKTGTANEQRDAWFNGYQRNNVTNVWVGFDTPEPMGRGETGGRAALPIWIEFMQTALEQVPEYNRPVPAGIIRSKINPKTGKLASRNNPNTLPEYFIAGNLPEEESEEIQATDIETEAELLDDLF
ncbi:MAG TPA: penicillin-binding protein 1A [Gammaproteobacteria bacterium]|nr:penicillin-binding protein 1A [Xanthomonadales bacterium]MCB1595159.1 penicillin-binding protein 1A [Xanthomonadales bacterium]HPI96222.1 penicillin-binding protein 1A [Gammaproteobacteria bacterium]HPQ87534.1 penicillin-binding protein 1A [Gammaproteobacteria bacterium]